MTSVRALEELVVALPNGGFTLSLARDSTLDEKAFLNELQEDFVRKVSQITTNRFFSVRGPQRLLDERVPRIFVAAFRGPYEKDGEWRLPVEGLSGKLILEQPVSVDVNTAGPASARASSSSRASKRHKPSEVRIPRACSCELGGGTVPCIGGVALLHRNCPRIGAAHKQA